MTQRGESAVVPNPVRYAALLTAGESAGLAVLCLIYLWAGVTGHPSDRNSALVGGGMGLGLAALLAVLARGLLRGRRPALTPVVLTQLFLLPVSWYLYEGGRWPTAAVVAALAVAVLGLLFGTAEARGTFS